MPYFIICYNIHSSLRNFPVFPKSRMHVGLWTVRSLLLRTDVSLNPPFSIKILLVYKKIHQILFQMLSIFSSSIEFRLVVNSSVFFEAGSLFRFKRVPVTWQIGGLVIPPNNGRKQTTSVFRTRDRFPGITGRNQKHSNSLRDYRPVDVLVY